MRDLAEVTTLRQRRTDMVDNFASKCATSERFGHWFLLKESGRTGNRREEKYLEEFARCDRLKNSPIFYMRRRKNGKPGRHYGDRNRKYRDT